MPASSRSICRWCRNSSLPTSAAGSARWSRRCCRGGGMLAGLVASWLLPIIGWRYLFLVGLSPLVLVFMIRYWVPESPRWLIRMGRREEARGSLAWALMIDPKEITLPPALPALEQTRWLE